MTLRKKTLLVSGAVICCLTIILLIATNTILLQGFTVLEKQDMEKNLKRAQNVLTADEVALATMLSDWSFWDDTYEFITNNNEDYIRKNLNDVTFTTQNLNFVMYINLQNQLVYGQGFDLEKKINGPLPEGLLEQLIVNKLLPHESQFNTGFSGIIILPEGPVMIATRPILDTDKQKPARGTMIAGRYITNEKMAEMADVAQLSLTSYLFDAASMPEDFVVAKSGMNMDSPVVIKTLASDHIAGYVLLPDIYSNPGLLLRVDTERHIYMQGKRTLGYVTMILISIGMLFGGIHLLFLEKTVLLRLTSLSEQVMEIGKEGNPAALVKRTGDDELADLADNINKMLNSLTLAQNELRTREVITSILLAGIPDSLVRIDQKGMILDFQTGHSRLIATSPQMMPGRNISGCYPSDVAKIFMWRIQVAIKSNTQQVFEYEVADSNNIYQEIRIDAIGENEVIAIVRDFEKII